MANRRRLRWIPVVLFGLLGAAPAAWANGVNIAVTYVGDNPFNGFDNTGGTGSIAGQGNGQATLEKHFTALGDVPFIVDGGPSVGVQTIRINERVRNDTGVDWSDFHLVVQSIDANPDLLVEFLNIDNPTGEFTSIMPMDNALWLIGPVLDGGIFSLSFDLQVTTSEGAYFLFGVHEYPTVPEPGALALVIPGLLGLWLTRRRR